MSFSGDCLIRKLDDKTRLLGLEVGRGVAASMVAMHHASNLLSQQRYGGVAPFLGIMKEFDVGVDFFFVLSGFLITWVHYKDIGNLRRLHVYLERRFTRIYPAYWCVVFPLIFIHLRFSNFGASAHYDLRTILCSILLLPNVNQPILGVAWTLVYEVYFYLIFAIVLVIGPRGWFLIGVWTGAIFVYSMLGNPTSWPENFLLDSRNLEFVIGILVARYLSASELAFPKTFLFAGLAAFFGMIAFRFVLVDDLQPLFGYSLFGLSAAAIIGGAVELERTGQIDFGQTARLLGGASYSIYLVHSIVEAPVCALALRYLRGLKPEFIWAILVVSGIGVGILFHLSIEKRVIHYVRNHLRRPKTVTG